MKIRLFIYDNYIDYWIENNYKQVNFDPFSYIKSYTVPCSISRKGYKIEYDYTSLFKKLSIFSLKYEYCIRDFRTSLE